jgi:hypothetical protein
MKLNLSYYFSRTSKWGLSLSLALSSSILIDGILSKQVLAICEAPLQNSSFDNDNRERGVYPLATTETRFSRNWVGEGRAGIDIKKGYARTGENNAWARNNRGWNALRQRIPLDPNKVYTIEAYVRTSGNVTDGYFGVRDATQKPYQEVKFGSLPNYTKLSVTFTVLSYLCWFPCPW